jgi:hypothetical protein
LGCASTIGLIFLLVTAGAGQDLASPPQAEAPAFIFLNGPFDLDAIAKRLERPDLVVLTGADYLKLIEAIRAKATVGSSGATIESVEVQGEVIGDRAHLTVEYGIVAAEAASSGVLVSIRLDGQVLTDAREGVNALELRNQPDGGWQVKLASGGRHRVRVGLIVPVRSTGEMQRLELAVPEAASTRLRLDLSGPVSDVRAGAKEPLAAEPIEDGRRSRVRAILSPRAGLDVSWRVASSQQNQGPPLLSTLGELALEVDRGTFRTRSTWSVKGERGAVDRLELTIDPADELIGLELDDQPIPLEGRQTVTSGLVTVPLPEPLRLGAQRRVSMITRRSLPAGVTTRVRFQGFPLRNAMDQSGLIAVVQGEDLWVSGAAGRGLRRIDPRSDLPTSLRGHPGTVYAYRFVEQPFELGLRVDPSPPAARVAGRTTLVIEPAVARVDAVFDYQVLRGRMFEVRVAMPTGLELASAGPPAAVEDFHWLTGGEGGLRTLVLRLTPRASQEGRFSIQVTARQALREAERREVALIQPRDVAWQTSRLAVVAGRGLAVQLAADPGARNEWTELQGQDRPVDWPTAGVFGATGLKPVLWLRHDDAPTTIPLEVEVRPPTLSCQTVLTALVEPRQVNLRQETSCQVHNDVLSRLEVAVPPRFEGHWEPDREQVTSRERLGTTPDGMARYRLHLARPVPDALQLRFQVSLPLDRPLSGDRGTDLRFPWIRMEGATTASVTVQVSAAPGVALEDRAAAWPTARGSREVLRWNWHGSESANAPALVARAATYARLPRLVVSRMWLDSEQDAVGGLHTTARYRVETSDVDRTLVAALPPSSELVRAWVGRDLVTEVDHRIGSAEYRVPLPDDPTGPVLVTLEYVTSPVQGGGGWPVPSLGEQAVVQETLWRVRLPRGRAVLGTPEGWDDENLWAWDASALRHRPSRGSSQLAAWVGGTTAAERPLAGPTNDLGLSDELYLFGRVGAPRRFGPRVVSRALLIGACSGLVLAIGIAFLVARPPGRLVGIGALIAALAATVTVEPAVLLLCARSSLAGAILVLVAAVTQRLVEGRRPARGTYAEPSGQRGLEHSVGSSRDHVPAVGSDASTVIRPRAASTLDQVAPVPETAAVDSPA